MKKTPWYPASIKPVRVGWYECAYMGYIDSHDMRYWNGQMWRLSDRFPDGPASFGISGHPKDCWRGLKKPVDNDI